MNTNSSLTLLIFLHSRVATDHLSLVHLPAILLVHYHPVSTITSPILIVIVFVFAFVIVLLKVMFSHHSDQMSQRSRCQRSLCVLQNQKVSVTETAKKWMSKGREIIECVNIWIWTRGHQKLW